jgi:hypothetical protein
MSRSSLHPNWFYVAQLGLRELPEGRAERAALVSGLEVLA